MSKTTLRRADGVRDGTEQKVTENYAVTYAKNLYDKEVAERAAADNKLQRDVGAEAIARTEADNTLQTTIDNHIATDADSDTVGHTCVVNEVPEVVNPDNPSYYTPPRAVSDIGVGVEIAKIKNLISQHAGKKSTADTLGHVYITETIEDNTTVNNDGTVTGVIQNGKTPVVPTVAAVKRKLAEYYTAARVEELTAEAVAAAIGEATNMVSITYAELLTKTQEGKLTPGQQYRITDYVTTTVQSNTHSAGHAFDIIVTADSTTTLNENARACLHAGDTYFASSDLAAWQIKYDIVNDTDLYAWADSTNGKGVIYEMTDEFGNTCPYDFKNIQFNDDGTYRYTFDVNGQDWSLNKNRYCYDNRIKTNQSREQTLNYIIFKHTSASTRFYNNTIDSNCHNLIFSGATYNTKISAGLSSKTFNNLFNNIVANKQNISLDSSKYNGYQNLAQLTADVSHTFTDTGDDYGDYEGMVEAIGAIIQRLKNLETN